MTGKAVRYQGLPTEVQMRWRDCFKPMIDDPDEYGVPEELHDALRDPANDPQKEGNDGVGAVFVPGSDGEWMAWTNGAEIAGPSRFYYFDPGKQQWFQESSEDEQFFKDATSQMIERIGEIWKPYESGEQEIPK